MIETPSYPKIAGWLYLVGIGVVMNPLFLLVSVGGDLLPLFFSDTWTMLTTPDSAAYHPMWAPLLIFELIGNVGLLLFSVVVAVLFFQKRKLLPKVIIAFMLSSLTFVVADHFLANTIPFIANAADSELTIAIIRSAVTCIIWIPYFLLSKRVKGTFVQ